MITKTNPKGAGRKPLDPENKKLNYTVTLLPADNKYFIERYGSRTAAPMALKAMNRTDVIPVVKEAIRGLKTLL